MGAKRPRGDASPRGRCTSRQLVSRPAPACCSAPSRRNSGGDFFDVAHNAEQVATPEFRDLVFGVAAPHELRRDVQSLARIGVAVDATAAIEVGADPDVVYADQLHRIVDVVDEVLHRRARRWWELTVDLRHPALIRLPFLRRERLEPTSATTAATGPPAAAALRRKAEFRTQRRQRLLTLG